MRGRVAAVKCPQSRRPFLATMEPKSKLIQPVVEGHGEEEALPVLLRRLRNKASAWAVELDRLFATALAVLGGSSSWR